MYKPPAFIATWSESVCLARRILGCGIYEIFQIFHFIHKTLMQSGQGFCWAYMSNYLMSCHDSVVRNSNNLFWGFLLSIIIEVYFKIFLFNGSFEQNCL